MSTAESEGRKALNRLRRAVEKSRREMDALRGAISHAEGDDFPSEEYEQAMGSLAQLEDFLERESARLQEKILSHEGLEPGRVHRGSAS